MYEPLNTFPTLLALVILLWTIPWKVYAVWLAVKNDQKKWFIALLVLNTVGILEIYYIFKVAHKSWDDVKGAWGRFLSPNQDTSQHN